MKSETRELIVEGTPRSLQATTRGRNQWKTQVVESAQSHYDDDTTSIQFVDVAVAILHFCPEWGAEGDLDNIAKPILDGLCDSTRVLFDDSQVKELLLRRIQWSRPGLERVENASPLLARRLAQALRGDATGDFVYIRVTTELALEKMP